MERRGHLIIIYLAHSYADFGSLRGKVPFNEEYDRMVSQYWREVSGYVRNLPVDFSQLRIYQDGLPDVSAEKVAKIVNETQTPNYDFLRWLREQGACILGTESPKLLLEEYRSLQAIFNAPSEALKKAARWEYMKKGKWLLEGRDVYIAQRIKETLPEGGTGILFIGLAHEVKRFLEKEVEITEPEILIGTSPEVLRKRLSGKERGR